VLLSTFRRELTQSFTVRTHCAGGTRPRDCSVINTVMLCPLYCYFYSTVPPRLHVQFIPRFLAPFTAFASVSFLPQTLHIFSTVCINLKSLSKVALSRICVARFTAERHGPVGVFPASYFGRFWLQILAPSPPDYPDRMLVVLLSSPRQI
jgi:hypothetical protein